MSDDGPLMVRNGGSRPVPDPTLLTTQQLNEAKVDLRRELGAAVDILRAELRVIDGKISSIESVSTVQHASIDNQFAAIEAWRKEQKVDTKTAVDAALTAASTAVREQTAAGEKAIAKSEASASEQGKLQAATFSAELKGISTVLTDVKDRVTKIEASKIGAAETTQSGFQSMGFLITVVLASIAVIGFVVTYVAR